MTQNTDTQSTAPINWPAAIVFLLTGLVAAIGVPWYGIVNGYHWGLWLGFVLVLAFNGMAITAGYHRLWAHRSYKAHFLVRLWLALWGAAAVQNSILVWCSDHRRHHRDVDHIEKDPYSINKGLWHAHLGWMLRDYPINAQDFSNAPDLEKDAICAWQHRYYLPITLFMNFVPAIMIGWLCGDIIGGMLVVGVLRLVASHHFTFFINSLAHFWGRQPYTDENSARDNDVLALVTWGEGYHNFHHIFQSDYRNGVRWWQFDPTKWAIKFMSWLGLTWDLRKVSDYKIQRALLGMQLKRAEQQLAAVEDQSVSTRLRSYLEQEYQQFRQNLQEWNELRLHWTDEQREKIAAHKLQIEERWAQANFQSQLRQLEYAIKMQRKRVAMLTLQMA